MVAGCPRIPAVWRRFRCARKTTAPARRERMVTGRACCRRACCRYASCTRRLLFPGCCLSAAVFRLLSQGRCLQAAMLPGKYCLPALSVRRLVPACVSDIVHHDPARARRAGRNARIGRDRPLAARIEILRMQPGSVRGRCDASCSSNSFSGQCRRTVGRRNPPGRRTASGHRGTRIAATVSPGRGCTRAMHC